MLRPAGKLRVEGGRALHEKELESTKGIPEVPYGSRDASIASVNLDGREHYAGHGQGAFKKREVAPLLEREQVQLVDEAVPQQVSGGVHFDGVGRVGAVDLPPRGLDRDALDDGQDFVFEDVREGAGHEQL